MSKPQRIMAILQLCIVFTLATSLAAYPFLGEMYDIKKSKLLLEFLMGKNHPANNTRFSQLSDKQQNQIEQQYTTLTENSQKPFTQKLLRSIKILLFALPPFERAWILLGTIIPILLLLRRDGAQHAAWLLPLIAAAYCTDNIRNSPVTNTHLQDPLFPTEQYLVDNYLDAPLSDKVSEQYTQLDHAWHLYLAKEWAKPQPHLNGPSLDEQTDNGLYAFQLARLKAQNTQPQTSDTLRFRQRQPIWILVLYVLWNLLFACTFIPK